MKVNTFFGILGFVLLLLPSALFSNEMFIRFDEACMDQYEYVYENPSQGNNGHLAYAIDVGQGRKIYLEVGAPIQRNFPQQTINCNNAFFDEQLVDAINQRIDQVFVITVKGSRYFASPVTMAAFYEDNGNVIFYTSPKYGFRFNVTAGAVGTNIGYGVRGANMTFEGLLNDDCSGTYAFRQVKNNSTFNDIISDVVFIPEVGVIEERIGRDVDDAMKNAKKLSKVNGKNLERFIKETCVDQSVSSSTSSQVITPYYQPQTTPYQPQQPLNEYYGGGVDFQAKGIQTTPTTPVTTTSIQYHTVKKGETLYSISKKYNLAISDLRDWNGLQNSNLIYKGDKLQVSGGTQTASTNVPTEFFTPNTTSPVSSSLAQRSPYASNTATSGDQYHTVRFGETVASIAMNYGLTEQKLRELNGLNSNEFVKVNQQLKVSNCNCPPASQTTTPSVTPYNQVVATPLTGNTNTYSTYPQQYSSGSTTGPVLSQRSTSTPQTFEQPLRNTPQFYQPEQSTTNIAQPIQPNYPSTDSYYTPPVNTTPQGYYQPSTSTTTQPRPQSEEIIPVFPAPQDDVVPQSYEFVPQYNRKTAGARKTHIVKDGEDLYKISQMYNTNVQRLLELNDMKQNEVLIPYQRIYVN